MKFPGSLVYYLLFGFYLSTLAWLKQTSTRDRLVVEKIGWVDLSAYLSWMMRHIGLPQNALIVLESRLLGTIGVIEPRMSEFMKSRQGAVFVDVGSYHGHYSLLLNRNFKEIVAVEPVPKNADFLNTVIAYRKVTNIRIVRMAASRQNGASGLRIMPQPSESKLLPQEFGNESSIKVETIRLDSLLGEYRSVDLVKLDVEGAEFDALEGASGSMTKIHSWLIELHGQGRAAVLEHHMRSNGYMLYWVDSNHLFAYR